MARHGEHGCCRRRQQDERQLQQLSGQAAHHFVRVAFAQHALEGGLINTAGTVGSSVSGKQHGRLKSKSGGSGGGGIEAAVGDRQGSSAGPVLVAGLLPSTAGGGRDAGHSLLGTSRAGRE